MTLTTFTAAGQGDIRQRLNADGVAALGQTAPLVAQAWTSAAPNIAASALSFTAAAKWFSPLPGMLIPIPDGGKLGLSALDGTPAVAGGTACEILLIHSLARLRLERLMVAALEAPGGPVDRSIRPVPATILITGPNPTVDVPWTVAAGEEVLPSGTVTMYDEHGLIIDPFAFAAAVAAVLAVTAAAGAAMPGGGPAGTLAAFAAAAGVGRFVHAIDLHGRPWTDPGGTGGIAVYSGAAGSRVKGSAIATGALVSVPQGQVIATDGNPDDAATAVATPGLTHFGWHTVGRMGVTGLAWPAAGAQAPIRDTLRLVAADPAFHLLGNRTQVVRDGVGGTDAVTAAEAAPIVREGSPVTLFADGRSVLGFMNQVFLGLQGGNPNGPFTTGPIFATSVAYDGATWPLPSAPGPAGAWPSNPVVPAVPGSFATVLGQFGALRTATGVNWVAGTNDVLVTLPAGLPVGSHVRLYPTRVLMGVSPDEQPLLRRADGPGVVVTAGTDTLLLTDPFALGGAVVRPADAHLRADAVVSWLPQGAAPVPQVAFVANLHWAVGADVPPPAAAPANILGAMFWRGQATNPMIGAPLRGPFPLTAILGDPIAWVRQTVRAMSSDSNPREAPRLPTMSRNESLWTVQMPPATPDLYRGVLTGGWLTSETDATAYRLGNPGGAGRHEVHAPGISASSQLGFDLWVAAAHRARPVVPTADAGAALSSGPNAGVQPNWVLVQANTLSSPPPPPTAASTVSAALLQTVPAFVETPELALIPATSTRDAVDWVTNELGTWVSTPNDPELHRQIGREIRTAKFGRRDTQWALRRALRHARELVYIETPLFCGTAHDEGGPADAAAAVDLVWELANRLTIEPRLRVVILVPRETPFVAGYEPFAMYHYERRRLAAQTLALAGGTVDGLAAERPRVVIAHPMGVPGRPLVIRTTTVIVDDTWCLTGASSFSRRGLTFDGSNDVVMTDWNLDRGASVAIRAHRKALMGMHLGVGPTPVGGGTPATATGAPTVDWVRLHQAVSAHEVFADVLLSGGRGKLLPLWRGPDPSAPGAVIPHPATVADPDGRDGASLITSVIAALGGNPSV